MDQSSTEEDEPSVFCEPTDIVLREAELSGKRIGLGLEIVDSKRYKSFSAVITFWGNLQERIAINQSGDMYSALITDSLEPRLQQLSRLKLLSDHPKAASEYHLKTGQRK